MYRNYRVIYSLPVISSDEQLTCIYDTDQPARILWIAYMINLIGPRYINLIPALIVHRYVIYKSLPLGFVE
jgi:hypothetical protein